MRDQMPVPMSATLAADEALALRRRSGEQVLFMASGEIGLPVHPVLTRRLATAARVNSYGPVAGSARLREAAAGYWTRRNLQTQPDLVVCGPGSKPLLFALMLAVGGDIAVPVPSWVSYTAQADLAGARSIPVPTRPGEGGVPDPELLRQAVRGARAAGRVVRSVVVTVPDNPTGTVATPETIRRLCQVAEELDLIIISDEIYGDLVFDTASPITVPSHLAPDRTVTTTGLTKNLALGGWRIGVARLPDSEAGRRLSSRLVGIASHIWSSPVAPVQEAAAYAFDEPSELRARVAASRRLHAVVASEVAALFTAAGALLAPVRATCYLYPDFAPLSGYLARAYNIRTAASLARHLLERYGVGVLPASAFGEPAAALRIRASVSQLYGDTDDQRTAALNAGHPGDLPWVRASVDRVGEVLADLLDPVAVHGTGSAFC